MAPVTFGAYFLPKAFFSVWGKQCSATACHNFYIYPYSTADEILTGGNTLQIACNTTSQCLSEAGDNTFCFMGFCSCVARTLLVSGACTINGESCEIVSTVHIHTTLREEDFHWNLNFAIPLMANSLNLNSANYYIFRNLSMIAYIIGIQKSKFAYI